MLTMTIERTKAIKLAVKRAYLDADLELTELTRGVIPLYEIICSYSNIRVVEIQELTTQKIEEFLHRETLQKFVVSENKETALAGYLYLQEYQGEFYGCIFIEKNPKKAPISRRRFSAAHELGHYLLHFLPLLEEHRKQRREEPLILTEQLSISSENEDEELEQDDSTSTAINGIEAVLSLLKINQQQMEAEADQFAAELLMPKQACFILAKCFCGRFGQKRDILAGRLASEFLVSKQAMKRRLEALELPEKIL